MRVVLLHKQRTKRVVLEEEIRLLRKRHLSLSLHWHEDCPDDFKWALEEETGMKAIGEREGGEGKGGGGKGEREGEEGRKGRGRR